MSARIIYHQSHGDTLHDLCIFLAELIIAEKGYKFLDGKAFKSKRMYPGEPDIYIELPIQSTDSHGKKTKSTARRVIEIETHATKASIEKKKAQFISSIMRTDPYIDLIIIPINECKEQDNWWKLYDFIGKYIP
jgi:hypothetical protein